MKKIFYILGLVFIGLSCSKKATVQQQVELSAKVNGVAWQTDKSSVSVNKISGLQIEIHATSAGAAIDFTMNPFTGQGFYNIATNSTAFYASADGKGSNINQANTGQINITDTYTDGNSITYIKGTFFFITDNNYNISDGAFTAAIQLN